MDAARASNPVADDPFYKGRYTGTPLERDGAYHQGTVLAVAAGAVRGSVAAGS